MMLKLKNFIKNNIFILLVIFVFLVNLVVTIRINLFRYNNFEFGKFDLGNMSQMVYNTLNGRFMYLTDYFGTNLPRWAMSHVDPILLIFIPAFIIFPHPLTLVFGQVILVLSCTFLIFGLSNLILKSKYASAAISLSFLFYPALGYLNTWTGYHGVSAAMFFFLLAFYMFEKMYQENKFDTKRLVIFWISLVLNMAGKEQIPLYIFMYGLFILFFRSSFSLGVIKSKKDILLFLKKKTVMISLSMLVVSMAWFIFAFLILIPSSAHYRIDGYQKFLSSVGISDENTKDVDLPNYFLARYDAFGDSYGEIVLNAVLNPEMTVKILFGGDKVENLRQTFEPIMYLSLADPFTLLLASPDFAINYLTSAGGIGTAEIYNHRISMIIPVLYVSVIFGVLNISKIVYLVQGKYKNLHRYSIYVVSTALMVFSIYTSFSYQSPVYLWLKQAITRRVFAGFNKEVANKNLEIGETVRLSSLDNKDVNCAIKVVKMIPDNASVSGPDYLGAHLSLRETYAIFPALYNEADYVIADVFSLKITKILDASPTLTKEVVRKLVMDPNYKLTTSCGSLFVFKNIGSHNKDTLLPIQERFEYEEKFGFEIINSLNVVDYKIPEEVIRGEPSKAQLVYKLKDNNSLNGFVLYMTFVSKKTGEEYQVANLPAFSLNEISGWSDDRYYLEDVDIALPVFLDEGEYKVFVGMSNKIKTRNVYLGNILVK